MSNLRLIGLILGVLGFLFTFFQYRGAKWNRLNFIIFNLFNFGLIIICINPEFANFLRDMLSLQDHQHGRLLALVVISNFFL
jgi:hypothetical protein